MFKKSALATAVVASFLGATDLSASTGNAFWDEGSLNGGLYNFTRIRDRKDLEKDKYVENIHHSSMIARVEFNSGLYKDFFGFDMGVVGSYDAWNSGSSHWSESSLVDEDWNIKNGFTVYKARARFDFDTVKVHSGYIQPSGPGVLGVNWSFHPGAYLGNEFVYQKDGLELNYFRATEYKNSWMHNTRKMKRQDGREMSYVHSMGAAYDFDNGLSAMAGFGQGQGFIDLYKIKVAYNTDDFNISYHWYGARDKDNTGGVNDIYDGLAYQTGIISRYRMNNWTFRADAMYTYAPGSLGNFTYRPSIENGTSKGADEFWFDSRSDFNHHKESVIFGGAWYDFSGLGYKGWSSGISAAYGWGAESRDVSVTTDKLKEWAINYDLGYTFQTGELKGASIALHMTYYRNETNAPSYSPAYPNLFQNEHDIKIMFMMPFSF